MTRDAKKFLLFVAVAILAMSLISVIVSAIAGGGSAVGENVTYGVSAEVRSLEVEIGAAEFIIVEGENFSVESNLKHLTVKQRGDRLIVLERTFGNNKKYNGAKLVICIPKDTVFDEIDITTGAGSFSVHSLSGKRVDLEFGAGEVSIGRLYASEEVDIEGGAGQITIGGGSLRDLQLDMGAGELSFTGEIVGEGELNLGVGQVRLNLLGGLDKYTVEMNKGIGDLIFNGESINGRTVGNGATEIEINGGIGSITVNVQ